MAVDPNLLDGARAQRERVARCEVELEMAKADYHHAIRRLHVAGATLREIAEALELSHQRVQQIVQAAGGTWWSRLWKSRAVRGDMICSFCGLPPGEVSKLIAGPKVYVCDTCAALAARCLQTHRPAVGPATRFEPRASTACSFCGKKPEGPVAAARDGRVCAPCLDLCQGIFAARVGP